MMHGRHERHGFCSVVIALLVGCSEVAPEAPARDAGGELDSAETSAVTDVARATDVVDAAVPTDRDHDASAADGTVLIDARADVEGDARADADASDASTVTDATSDVVDARTPTDGGDAATADVAASSAEFLAIYEGILRPRCATSDCHVVGSTRSRLVMTDAASTYARLVNVRDECSYLPGSRMRVVPFDPSMSAILLFDMDGLCGRRHNTMLPSSYGDAQRDTDAASFRAWIMAGAR